MRREQWPYGIYSSQSFKCSSSAALMGQHSLDVSQHRVRFFGQRADQLCHGQCVASYQVSLSLRSSTT